MGGEKEAIQALKDIQEAGDSCLLGTFQQYEKVLLQPSVQLEAAQVGCLRFEAMLIFSKIREDARHLF